MIWLKPPIRVQRSRQFGMRGKAKMVKEVDACACVTCNESIRKITSKWAYTKMRAINNSPTVLSNTKTLYSCLRSNHHAIHRNALAFSLVVERLEKVGRISTSIIRVHKQIMNIFLSFFLSFSLNHSALLKRIHRYLFTWIIYGFRADIFFVMILMSNALVELLRQRKKQKSNRRSLNLLARTTWLLLCPSGSHQFRHDAAQMASQFRS